MKRVLAILGAGLMIVVAIVVRAALDDDENVQAVGDLRVICVTELRSVCDALDGGEVQDVGRDRPALGADELDADVWVTFERWPEVADIDADRSVTGEAIPVASTPLAVVVWKDRAAELEKQACPGAIGWRCLGEAGGRLWADIGSSLQGEVKSGCLRRRARRSPVARQRHRRLLRSHRLRHQRLRSRRRVPPVAERHPQRTDHPGSAERDAHGRSRAYAAVGTTEADAKTLGARADELDVLYPAPEATVRIVLVPVEGTSSGSVERLARSDALPDALEQAGFDLPPVRADRPPRP